ncbi:MAG TPA: chromosome segregation protein SMC, partial [Allocoleopsis sp.]
MVYIKSVELSHFKSFGGTTNVPLLPGFTVVSGPNGSGKSNILDALLFCLGLASSKGMRAERLPDLINHNHPSKGTSEAIVTVTFDLENESLLSDSEEENQPVREWSVTRKLRVTASGSYTSNYYINGSPATLTELHEKLNKLRVYPEGYNVVLQGDVTSIISMNPKERREIIDELAGVATFDRKIIQTKETLASVKEKEDSCRIIETELINQLERLSQDKIKAEKYQKLRTELQEKELFAVVLKWRSLLQQQSLLTQQITTGEQTQVQLSQNLLTLNQEIDQLTQELDQLNILVKSLGEDELISFQSILATQQVNLRQLQKQKQDLESSTEEREMKIKANQTELSQNQQVLVQLSEELSRIETELTKKNQQKTILQQTLIEQRQQAENIASASDVWVQQQTSLTHNIEELLQIIEPKRTEQTQLRERYHQLGKQINQQNQTLNDIYEQISTKNANLAEVENNYLNSLSPLQNLENSLNSAERELQIQKETETRILSEQRDKQRQLDKLETQLQVQQESSGTYALQIITQSGLTGICGLVAQLGKVEPRYQLALEICAGGRLGNLVVEDDGVAAAAIQLLKQRKAGRMTFLPLNKIQAPRYNQTTALRYAQGYIDYAVNLIECEQRYRNIFAYVFGGTVIFDKLESARAYLGQYRIVTLDGELLESSGAMTGGSMSNNRSGLHFGTVDLHDSTEINNLKQRLHEIDVILARCLQIITQKTSEIKIKGQELNERKQQRRELQLQVEQLQREINSLTGQREQLKSVLNQSNIELGNVQESLRELDQELPGQESELQRLRQALSELEKSQTNAQWQQINSMIKQLESQLSEQDQLLRQLEQNEQKLINQQQRLQEKNLSLEEIINQLSTDDVSCQDELDQIGGEIFNLQGEINETQRQISEVEKRLGESKE